MKYLLLFLFSLSLARLRAQPVPTVIPPSINALLEKNTCLNCHRLADKVIGPSYLDVGKRNYSVAQIVSLIYKPKPSNWPGYPQMAPMTFVSKAEAKKMAEWIASLGKPATRRVPLKTKKA